jgi:hypothetical protein
MLYVNNDNNIIIHNNELLLLSLFVFRSPQKPTANRRAVLPRCETRDKTDPCLRNTTVRTPYMYRPKEEKAARRSARRDPVP